MIYEDMPLATADGAILAHSQFAGKKKLKKGHTLTSADVTALKDAGLTHVPAYRLEEGDVGEDTAADRLAAACQGLHLDKSAAFTGRCNLYATAGGVVVYDRDRLNALNLTDEALTVATLPPFEAVEAGRMVATIKIIPFAVPETLLNQSIAALEGAPLLTVQPWQELKTGLIETLIPGSNRPASDKLVQITAGRLETIGASLEITAACDHTADAVAHQITTQMNDGCTLILIAGASAVTDRRDVVPAGIEAAGGAVDHFGMPVDPGNLLLLGHVGETPVIGLPGCARSPKLNGFDWVLQRIGAGLTVTPEDIMRMGAGGLLKEIASRPLPRRRATGQPQKAPRASRIAALLLAAGSSRRMGAANKLLRPIDGQPMVRHTAQTVENSKAGPVFAVTGHQQDEVRAALDGLDITVVHNPDHDTGMASSLKSGLAALPDDIDGVVVCLGDMPLVTPQHIDRLIAAFDEDEGRTICVPTHQGKWGNPILWGRRYIAEMRAISGDKGARELLHAHADDVCEVPMEDDGILRDFDTPEAFGDSA